jgi:hypothetical protein
MIKPGSEDELHVMVAEYLTLRYPSVLFHSDFGSGIKLTMGQAAKQKRLQGGKRSWPDLFIASPRYISNVQYAGLFIELKKQGTKLYLKDGITMVANEHFKEQAVTLSSLRQRGYSAVFGIGFDATKIIIDNYLI